MSELKLPDAPVADQQAARDEWVGAVESLVRDIEGWCRAKDWPTRRIPKRITEPDIGEYVVPALLVQVDLARMMVEPVAARVGEEEGLIDLYLMPAYDDIARLFLTADGWRSHYVYDGPPPAGSVREPPAEPFDLQVFGRIARTMAAHARA